MKAKFFDVNLFKSLMEYNGQTGSLTWLHRDLRFGSSPARVRAWNKMYAGKPALNSLTKSGYLHGNVLGSSVFAHRACAALIHGVWPAGDVDHLNGIKTDNRLDNLRVVTRSHNQRNARKKSNNKSGVCGVSWSSSAGKWLARGTVDGEIHYLGIFVDINDATKARRDFEKFHGFTDRHGKV